MIFGLRKPYKKAKSKMHVDMDRLQGGRKTETTVEETVENREER